MATIAEILIAQGRQAADAKRTRGAAWMPLVQTLANLPAQVSADRAAQRQAEIEAADAHQRRQLTGLQMARTVGELEDQDTARGTAARERQVRDAMLDVLNQEDVLTPEGFDLPRARAYAESQGYLPLLADVLIKADREHDTAVLEGRTKAETLAKIQRERATAERGEQRERDQQGVRQLIGQSIAGRGGQPIDEATRQQFTAEAFQQGVTLPAGLLPEREEEVSMVVRGPNGRPTRVLVPKSQLRNGGVEEFREPQAAARQTLTPNMEANVIRQLATQWTAATAPARELERQVSIMDEGIKAARAGNLNAGGQAVLVTFQKILDPNSVVRESEFDRSREGIALMQRAQGAYERLTRGGPGVPLAELEQFARLAREIAAAQQSSRLTAIQDRIGRVADRYTIPRELVFEGTPEAPQQQPPQPAGPVRGPGAGPVGGRIGRFEIVN